MNKTITQSLFLLVFNFITLSAIHAQNSGIKKNVKGKIQDEQQNPIPYAAVSLCTATDSLVVKGTLTNTNGEFNFENIPDGKYRLSVDYFGYTKYYTIPFELKNDHLPDLPSVFITLVPQVKQLNTVTVTASKPLIEKRNNKTIVNVASSILAAGNSAMEILAKAPGVSVDHEGNVSLRGKGGVNVMIDDKETHLSAEQLAELLRATNGNSIQTIELMSNPSAKYDASGSGGIINIKLKKNSNYGTNGNLTAGAGYGRFYKSNAGITFNNRSKNLNIFGSYNYSDTKDFEDLRVNRSSVSGGETTQLDLEGRDIYVRKNNSYQLGADYYLNDKNIIGFVAKGYRNTNTIDAQYTTRFSNHPALIDSSVIASNPGRSKYTNIAYNLNYKSVIDTMGQELSADADFTQFNSTNEITYNNYFHDASGTTYKNPLIYKNATPSDVTIWTGKVDYVYPFSKKTKLETGIKSSYVRTDNDFQFENLEDGVYKNDVLKSNRFIYKEYVNAAYANLHQEFNSTSVQAGLRTELTSSDGNSINSGSSVKRNYFDFFPSIAVNQQLSENHEVGISYNRRIDRPDYHSLNPFIYYTDLYTLAKGNPLLNPQYTNAFELSYGYKKTLQVTFGYSHTTDVITTTLTTDTIKKTLTITDQNLAVQQTYNLNINKPFTIAKWWNTTNDLTFFYNKLTSPNLMGSPFKSQKFSYLINTTQSFQVAKTINAELSAFYHSAQVYGTYAVKPLYSIDLGISKSFANQKANLKLSASDILNRQRARITSAIPFQDFKFYQKAESRIFRLTFSYNFGSTQIKAARERSTGSEAEQNRAKSGN